MMSRSLFRREVSLRSREALHGYGFILIWVVGFALFTFLPLVETFRYSVNQVTVTATSINLDFVEWANYTRALFTDPNFVELLVGYTIETLVSVPIVLIFAMLIAMFLNLKFRFKGLFRTIFFFAYRDHQRPRDQRTDRARCGFCAGNRQHPGSD